MNILADIDSQIRAFEAEHGCLPTHMFIPAGYIDDLDSMAKPVIRSVRIVEVFDSTIKQPLLARCKTYALSA